MFDLANANMDEILKCWEGLGYYSRARNLHQGAKYIVENFGGQLPASESELLKIKGIGRYTVGALLSFAFHQKKAAVDGNVLRVVSRYFKVDEEITKNTTVSLLSRFAESLLPEEEPWIISEALIELGATLCQKKPQCMRCPLRTSCQGYLHGVAHHLPKKSERPKTERLFRAVVVIKNQTHLLVKKGMVGEIMQDLYEFPFFEIDAKGITLQELSKIISSELQCDPKLVQCLPQVKHSFTRFQVKLDPFIFTCEELPEIKNFEWISMEEVKKKAFSAGHRKILQMIAL